MARHKDPFARSGGGGRARSREPNQVWNQAVAAHRDGQFAQAEKLYRQVIKAAGARPEALRGLAAVQGQLGRHLEALKSIERAHQLAPGDVNLLQTKASILLGAGRPAEAVKVFRKVLAERGEGSAEAWMNLGFAQRAAGEQDAAEASLRRALEIDPRLVQARHELGHALSARGAYAEAARELRRCTEEHPGTIAGWLSLGSVEQVRGRSEAAERCFRRAIELQPHLPIGHSNLGQALREAGRSDEAIAAFERAVELNPDFGQARIMLAATRKYRERDANVAWLEKQLHARRHDGYELHDLLFVWAKLLKDLGDDEGYMTFLHRANATKRATLDYDVAADIAHLSAIAESFDAANLAAASTAGGSPDATPIFVCGMPRSGTTLVEQILASHPAIIGAGELTDLGMVLGDPSRFGDDPEPLGVATAPPESLRAAGDAYVRRIRDHGAHVRHIVDKMPYNAIRIGAIRRILPAARIVLCRRDPRDVCLSNYRTNFEVGQHYSYDLTELGHYHRAHDTLLDHWVTHVAPNALIEVHYEQLVADLDTQARRLCTFLDLPWDDAMLRPHETVRAVRTASLQQVRQPVYRTSVGTWQRYADDLAPLLEALT